MKLLYNRTFTEIFMKKSLFKIFQKNLNEEMKYYIYN